MRHRIRTSFQSKNKYFIRFILRLLLYLVIILKTLTISQEVYPFSLHYTVMKIRLKMHENWGIKLYCFYDLSKTFQIL